MQKNASFRLSTSALKYMGWKNFSKLRSVKLPSRPIKAKYTTNSSGTSVNITIQMA